MKDRRSRQENYELELIRMQGLELIEVDYELIEKIQRRVVLNRQRNQVMMMIRAVLAVRVPCA